ncbi:MAG: SusC/RagA family TonB-linked outer membrane protein [Bacteroidota bacterium]
MLSKILFTLPLALLLAIGLQAQVTVKGSIVDAATGEYLVGATIAERGSTRGTASDAAGQFELQVSSTAAVLSVQYIGYQTVELPLAGQVQIDIALRTADAILDEVVVTSLGLERSSKQLGYAVQQIEAQELNEVKSANLVQSLAGKVAGVTVNQGATGIGSTSKITIRGEASFTNNNPLFIVDGMPINNNSILNFTNEAAAGFQEVDFGNGAMDVNIDDIESVSVLKGPSAAALYGTRASNGVILITTKTGERTSGIGVSFNSIFSVETPFQLPQFQNRYGQGNSGVFEFVDGLGGGTNDNITYSWGPALDRGVQIAQFDSPVRLADGRTVRGGDVAVHGGAPIVATPFVAHPDNLSDFYRTGHTISNNLALDGAYERGHYRISLSDFRNVSIIPGTDLERQNLTARLQFRPLTKLEFNSSIQYVRTQSDNRPAGGYGSENVNYSLVAWGPRSLDTDVLRDYWQPGLEGVQQYSFNYTFFDNPYFILLENRNAFQRDRLFGNFSARYTFNDQWSLTARTGLDLSNEDRTFRRHFSSNRFRNGAYAEHDVGYREQNTDVLLHFRDAWQGFELDFSLGGNRFDQWARSRQTQTVALAQPGIFSLANAAAPIEAFSFDGRKRINSVFAVAKLGIKNQLFFELTGRNDWSSALATPTSADGASFFYPSASASWVVSNSLQLPQSISFLQVRANWAQVGNDTDPYQTSGVFVAQTPFNSQPTFSAQDIIANGSLQPEKTSAIEVGGDLRFWDDRLQFDLTYYDALTQNQIIALPVAISSGFNQQVVNGSEVRSRGLEIVAGVRPFVGPKFSWYSGFNFSRNVTTVEDLPDEIEGRLTLAYSRVYDNVNQTVWVQVEEGGRIGDLYGTGYLKNENGDFVIDADGRFIVDNELIKLGNYNPDFILGWTNQLHYRNWDLHFLFDWRQGGILVSRTQALAGVGGQLIETEDRPAEGIVADGVVNVGSVENPVWEPNTTAVSPESYYRQFYDRNHEENNTYNATYFKLRELSLAYTFRRAVGFFSGGRQLRISLIGRNLFAFSEIPHFDPEQLAVQGTQFVSGIEDMSYATSRSVGIKVAVQF